MESRKLRMRVFPQLALIALTYIKWMYDTFGFERHHESAST